MLFSRNIPKKADIFIQSKYTKLQNKSYKPLKAFKIFGIIIGSVMLLSGVAVFFAPGQNIASGMMACPLHPIEPNNGSPCNNWWWNNQSGANANPNANTTNFNRFNNSHINFHNNVITTQPVTPFPSNNFSVASTQFTPIQTQFETANIVSPAPSINTNQFQTNGGNIGGINSQIIAIQQQIGGQMQACTNNAIRMANQIVALMNQQKQLQAQIDALNNQANNIDTSTQAGQNQQDAMNQRIQQLQQQSDNLGNAISNAQDNMNNANSQCQDNVSTLEQRRGDLESNLDDAFNNAMNIQIPSD